MGPDPRRHVEMVFRELSIALGNAMMYERLGKLDLAAKYWDQARAMVDWLNSGKQKGRTMSVEIWKDIHGFEGFYQVSNFGRVCGLPRTVVYSDGRVFHYKLKLLNPRKHNPYKMVSLRKGKKGVLFYVHRLVAYAFLGPDPVGKEVNHKNGKTGDNRVENLEWVSHKENMIHSIQIGLRKRWGSQHGSGFIGEKA